MEETMNEVSMLQHRNQIALFSEDMFRICEIEFAQTSEVQRQICGAFLFGMVFVHGMAHQLQPPQVHALSILMLEDVLRYSPAQAGAFSTRLVQASSTSSPNDTMKAIIHRGIDGHHQLTSGQNEGLRQNLLGIFKSLNAPYNP
jgi:hypothetical protein